MATDGKEKPLGFELISFFQLQRSKSIKEKDSTGVSVQLFNHFAKTEDDFNAVFERELKKTLLDFSSEADRDLFRTELRDRILAYIERYREFSKLYPDKRNLRDLKTAISFMKWLEEKPEIKTPKAPGSEIELSLNQIALIYVYEGWSITRTNAQGIAEKYGFKSAQSLYSKYTTFRKTRNRTIDPDGVDSRKILNKIELFESVIPHVSTENRQRIEDEVEILKSIAEKKYLLEL